METRQKNGQDVINWPAKLNSEFFNMKKLADSHDPRITEGLKARMANSEAEWNKYKAEYETVIKKAVAAYNVLFKKANFPALIL